MKFFAEPNHYVRFFRKNLRNGNKKGFYFNDKGEYVTNDVRIIEALKIHFKFEDDILPIQDEIEPENEATEAPIIEEEQIKTFDCKKCEFKTVNKGELLAHYRKDHKE